MLCAVIFCAEFPGRPISTVSVLFYSITLFYNGIMWKYTTVLSVNILTVHFVNVHSKAVDTNFPVVSTVNFNNASKK